MGKISPVSAKYIIHANISIDGVVDKPDVIGAIFGQTEGLLGSELELRELQKSGRIGRIEVNLEVKGGKTTGTISIPSSLDKAETAIVAASLEVIQRIGPCNAKVKVEGIEDVRVSRRKYVVERAKELLKQLIETVMPDSQELSDEVAYSVRMMEIQDYGRERLPAGPNIDDSDEIIVVEGRADVLNLLKHGFKNAIAINGTSVPKTIIDLSKEKTVTAFVDGDRGGDLILRELFNVAEIDFVARAPDGKEVEEITKKEIHKALRSKITAEQYLMETGGKEAVQNYYNNVGHNQQHQTQHPSQHPQNYYQQSNQRQRFREQSRDQRLRTRQELRQDTRQGVKQEYSQQGQESKQELNDEAKSKLKELSENLLGTRGACILDEKLEVLGKVPLTELAPTLKNLNSVYAVVLDGVIDKNLARIAEKSRIKVMVANELKVRPQEFRMKLLTPQDL